MILDKKNNKTESIPQHVGIIMDGNGRWAKQRNLPREEGHKHGADVIEPVMDCAIELGIKAVSLYAFSVENWSRPVTEVYRDWETSFDPEISEWGNPLRKT